MNIYNVWTGRLFAIPTKEWLLPEIKKHNFGTVNGEKLTDTIPKAEMSKWDQILIWVKDTQMCIT